MVGLTRISLANRAVVALVTVVLIGLGLYATTALKQEIYPSISIPGATVTAVYPGAPSGTVERDVTKPLEDAVKSVTGVTRVTSVSGSNVSQISVEWDFEENSTEMESKVRAAAESTRSTLPADVEPQVIVGSLDDLPVVVLAVSSDKDPNQLSEDLNNIAVPQLSAIPGVRDVTVSGEEQRQVVITTRQADLNRLKVDASQIPQTLPVYRSAIPGGDITQDGQNINVQVGRSLTSVDDVKQIRLQGTDGPVALGDVADVAEVPVEASSISRVNGEPSLTLMVTKTPEANTVTVATAIHEELPGISQEIGSATEFATVFDQAPWIEQSIHDLGTEGGLGLVMAVLVILIFLLSARATLITAISIPMSLLIAMVALFATDNTLNLLTLSALTVAVGRVVDDSIVVIENIKRHVGLGEEFGTGLIISAVREVAGAVTASTITTVAVFLPLALVSGQVGELFRPFALTVTVALAASLLVSLTLVPVLSYWFMRPTAKQLAKMADRPKVSSMEDPVTSLQKGYLPILRWSLKRPLVTSLIAVVLFAGTMVGATALKTDFIGSAGETSLSISQEMPLGTSLEETDAAAKKVEAVVAANPAVDTYSTSVGGGGGIEALFGGGSGSNISSISVNLKPGSDGTAVADQIRGQVNQLEDVGEVEVVTAGGAGQSTNLEVQVIGRDEAGLAQASEQVVTMMRETPGVEQVSSDLSEQQAVLQVDIRAADAAAYGMNQGTIGQAVVQAMNGTPQGEISIDGRTMSMILRSQDPVRTRAELENLPLPVTQKQTLDEQQRLSDELTAEQDEQAAEQRDKQYEQLDEQEEKLREQQAEMEDQLAELIDQIEQLENAPTVAAPPIPANAEEAALAQAQAQAQAAAQARAQREAQLEQLQDTRTQLQEQLDALGEQFDALADSRADIAEGQLTQEDRQARSEAAREATGQPRLLKEVADVREVASAGSIRRVGGERTVSVTGVPTGGDLGATSVALTTGLAELDLPSGVTASIGGVSSEQDEAFAQLGLAMLIAIAVVYMVMVATFRSLLQPLILLVSVPFAATGAVALLLLTGTALGVASMIGLLMLIGIVVTNAIVLIDLVNHYRRDGASIDDAVIHGARLRLRPIIMTALATIMALVPMAIGITGGGIFISQSLAIVVIGGLVSSTLLTLILVPVLYHLVENLREGRGRSRRAVEGDPEPGDPSGNGSKPTKESGDTAETVGLDIMDGAGEPQKG